MAGALSASGPSGSQGPGRGTVLVRRLLPPSWPKITKTREESLPLSLSPVDDRASLMEDIAKAIASRAQRSGPLA